MSQSVVEGLFSSRVCIDIRDIVDFVKRYVTMFKRTDTDREQSTTNTNSSCMMTSACNIYPSGGSCEPDTCYDQQL